jgi:heat shock protein HslJ
VISCPSKLVERLIILGTILGLAACGQLTGTPSDVPAGGTPERTEEQSIVSSPTPEDVIEKTPESESETPRQLSLEDLQNAAYPLEYASSGTAQLVNGVFREQAAPGSATEIIVQLSDFVIFEEMQSPPAAAAILISDTGGSGTFYNLALVETQDGKPIVLGTVFLGDRIVVKSLQLADGQIVVEMTTQGSDDPMTSPSQEVRSTYALQEGELVLTDREILAPEQSKAEAGSPLTGIAWQWVHFMDPLEEYEVSEPENYTLEFFVDGTLHIQADCNRASGSYIVKDASITIEIGPMTLAACPPGSRSEEFLQNLGFAAIYFFQEGDLFMDLMADGGTMKFQPLIQSN